MFDTFHVLPEITAHNENIIKSVYDVLQPTILFMVWKLQETFQKYINEYDETTIKVIRKLFVYTPDEILERIKQIVPTVNLTGAELENKKKNIFTFLKSSTSKGGRTRRRIRKTRRHATKKRRNQLKTHRRKGRREKRKLTRRR
jgi:hypothetical protein